MKTKKLIGCLAAVALATLTYSAYALTPEGLISANRYSAAVPNPSGDFAIFTVTNYSFSTSTHATAWKRLDLESGDVSLWHAGSDISEVVFVGPTTTSLIYINSTNEEGDGGVSLYYADAAALDHTSLIASLPAPYSGLKAAVTPSGDIHFLVYASAWPNGTAYNQRLSAKPKSTARIYSSTYVRHWNYYLTERRNAVFGGVLTPEGDSYTLRGNLTNYVTGICNVTCAESPLDLDGSEDYDLSPDGSKVVFNSKDIDLPLANYTSSQIWYVPFDGSAGDAVRINARGATSYSEAQGASLSPRFSPDGNYIAYVQQNGIFYESDRTILYFANADPANFNVIALAKNWDRSPDIGAWGRDSATIFTSASDLGRVRIFPVPLSAGDSYEPKNITDDGATAAYYTIPNGSLLVSDSKLWSSRDIYTTTPDGKVTKTYFQANLVDPELTGLGPEDIKQQSWIVFPEGFDRTKKYPLAFITHGGPQGGQYNNWSVRWNLKVWADQGYVNLTDAVQGRWGSYPYWDFVHAWKYVNRTLDYVDTSRGIEAGASYGGYMTNWIQGHEMGRWFKALVTHDGSTSTLSQYASEELWFMNHDFSGPFNETALVEGSPYYDWNPIQYVDNWATPHFVVHSDNDYRLPVSEGILLFNLLQVKGVPSKFLNFPDETHYVSNPENSLVWHTEIFKWINFYSGISNASSPY
ncbi:Alpha/Beta hydrolase protein [Phialemonium atrogriseum]|uniref:Dipeptidyl-peptidase V n=1 Tax=Phialemonium atrogriseum TaxID=1093897 RepID=A0AAJ0FHZ0_9PEZI|nr:Alpha/Beta hydrolase protein [Phialemonium atrogriseum]KAK1762719.1 Alpha/Beta hydrolase protein [Phialemonium atrogriseum]